MALRPHLDAPFALVVHSNDALLAFELTRRVRREAHHARALDCAGTRRAAAAPDRSPCPRASEPQFLQELRRYGGTPEALMQDGEVMALFLPVLRAHFALSEKYVSPDEPPLDLSITAFGGVRDDEVEPPAVVAAWGAQTTRPFAARCFPATTSS